MRGHLLCERWRSVAAQELRVAAVALSALLTLGLGPCGSEPTICPLPEARTVGVFAGRLLGFLGGAVVPIELSGEPMPRSPT